MNSSKNVSNQKIKIEKQQNYSEQEEMNESFKNGVWIRIVGKIEDEVDLLNFRYENDLMVFDKKKLLINSKYNTAYKFLSSSTLVISGIPTTLFNSKYTNFGVIFKCRERKITSWYSGLCKNKSLGNIESPFTNPLNDFENKININYDDPELRFFYSRNNYRLDRIEINKFHLHELLPSDHQCQNEDEKTIAKKYGKLCGKVQNENPSFSYNEGLICYRKKDIIGFYVGINRSSTCDYKKYRENHNSALKLKEKLGLEKGLFIYYPKNLLFCGNDLIKKKDWNIIAGVYKSSNYKPYGSIQELVEKNKKTG